LISTFSIHEILAAYPRSCVSDQCVVHYLLDFVAKWSKVLC